jgi:hypothetical protein
VWLGLALLLLVLLIEAVTVGIALGDLKKGSDILAAAVRGLGTSPQGWTADHISMADSQVKQARPMIESGRSRIKADPLLQAAARLPVIGDQVTAVSDLADTGETSSSVIADYLGIAREYEAARGQQGPPGPRLVALLKKSAAPLSDADARLTPQIPALRRDQERPLLPPLRDRVRQALDTLGPLQQKTSGAAAAVPLIPRAIGSDRPQRYLLLFANPAELRPAGGYVGVLGTVTLSNGAVQDLHIQSEQSYSRQIKQPFDTPPPLARFFNVQKAPFALGEAGWDPNFPASAALSERMFKAATGLDVDGTISLDPYAISALLAITGPVDVPGYGRFDEQNFFPQIDFIVNVKQGPASGKEALPAIARVILQKILQQPVGSWPKMLGALQQQAGGRHIQTYLHDAALQSRVAAAHYDGAILTGGDDSVMVVDANVAGQKSDYYLTKSAEIKAELPPSGVSRHEILLHYTLPLPADAIDRALSPNDHGAYLDYVRVYLPETASAPQWSFSQDSGPVFAGLDTIEVVNGKKVVSGSFRLPRGQTGTVKIDYDLPLDGAARRYELLVQKQAGIPERPTTLQVSFPGGQATRRSQLKTDARMVVTW